MSTAFQHENDDSPAGIGHSLPPRWPFVIRHSSFVILCLVLSLVLCRGEETNSTSVEAASVAANVDTNSSTSLATNTNNVVLRALESGASTNSPASNAVFAAVDTNSPGFSSLETNPAAVRSPGSTPRFDLQSFRIIAERNIFNPNRRPYRGGRRDQIQQDRPPRPRSQSFALIGTMSYQKGDFAIFEGSSSEYRKVLSTADTIAGYKIAEIGPGHIKLEGTNGLAIDLPIGKEMRKGDEEEWRLENASGRETSNTTSSISTTNAPSGPAEKTDTSVPSAENDILKRLLEKREQELNK